MNPEGLRKTCATHKDDGRLGGLWEADGAEQISVEQPACLGAVSPREGSMGDRGTLSHQALGPHRTPAPQTPPTVLFTKAEHPTKPSSRTQVCIRGGEINPHDVSTLF